MSTNSLILKTYWHHAWRYPRYVIGLFFMMPITLLVHQFLPPLIAARVLDRLSTGQYEKDKLWEYFGSDLILYATLVLLGGAVIWRIVIILIWKLEAKVTRDIYRRMFSHLMDLSAQFHTNSFGGSLVSQTNKFAGSYIRLADTTVFQIYTLLISLTITSIILLPRAPLYVGVLLLVSAIFIVTSIFVTRGVRKLHAAEAKLEHKQTGVLADMITNVLAVKSFSAEERELNRFKKTTEDVRLATMEVMRAATKRDVYFGAVTATIDGVSLVLAAASVVVFDANIGTVFLVLNYTANILHRLWEFSQNTLRQINRALGDARDGAKNLALQPDVKDPTQPEKPRIVRGAITFDNVTFTHPENEGRGPLFTNLKLSIKPGEKIGLVGPSGSGKTSLTKLLLRFSDIQDGEIRIDNQNIANLTQRDLRDHIAYVPQEPLLFHRSISENISYGNPGAEERHIKAIAKMANAHDFVMELPKQYETLVGERGVKLSGGQRQRIAIARAMIKNSPILVLDEATSALDSESEVLIQDALWKLMEGRTAIVIAHRLSTIQRMDRIIVLDGGKIVEEGSHRELLRNPPGGGGIYAKLWSHQSGGFLEG